MTNRSWKLLGPLLAALLLTGCIGKLLGGGKPVQLYRLGTAAAEEPAIVTPASARAVVLLPVRADPAIDGDRMLASRGPETSYIAGARWIAPVPVQFEQALRAAVRRGRSAVTLVDRRDGIAADRAVQITISRFEARFTVDPAAPVIVVEGEARLIDLRTRGSLGTFDFNVSRPARSPLIAEIVEAFDGASSEAIGKTADWLARNPQP